MGSDFMADRAFHDALDNVRGVPERVLLVIRAGVVDVPVACPQLVAGRTRHVRMGESARSPFAALEEQVADRGPSYGEIAVLEDPQKVRDILATLPSPLPCYFLRMHTKSPTQLQIRRDAGCGFGIVFEGGDFDAVKHSTSRLDSGAPVPLEGEDRLQQGFVADPHNTGRLTPSAPASDVRSQTSRYTARATQTHCRPSSVPTRDGSRGLPAPYVPRSRFHAARGSARRCAHRNRA